jgi:hypothetical protein
MIIGFRYPDEFEERDDEWRISYRRFVFDWNHVAPCSGIIGGGLWDGTPTAATAFRMKAYSRGKPIVPSSSARWRTWSA